MKIVRLLVAGAWLMAFAPGLVVEARQVAPVLDESIHLTYQQQILAWQADRLHQLTRPNGWLTLIGLSPLQTGTNTLGCASDNSIEITGGPSNLGKIDLAADGSALFTAGPGVEVKIGGTAVTQAKMVDDRLGEPTIASLDTISFEIIDRGGTKYLRVRDSASVHRKRFVGLEYFPIDPGWRIEADWMPFAPPQTHPVPNVLGKTTQEIIPGKAVFQRDGQTCELLPIQEGKPDEPLFFVFSDLTSGKETYAASRFLYADPPKNGKIVLDFNKAFNPPCAFTAFATCPLPMPENRLKLTITAGEKKLRGGRE